MKAEKTIKSFQQGNSTKIIALGDSLTNGWMVQKGYLDFLDEMLREKYSNSKFTIINRGVPGGTADGGLYRIQRDVIDYDPDSVLVQFALNDFFIGISPEQYQNYIQSIIDQINLKTSAETILVTSVCLGNRSQDNGANVFYNKLEKLAEVYNLPIARVHQYWKRKIMEGAEFRKLVQYDMVHPTVEGYRLMAEAVMEIF